MGSRDRPEQRGQEEAEGEERRSRVCRRSSEPPQNVELIRKPRKERRSSSRTTEEG